jgi:hypothetical protein
MPPPPAQTTTQPFSSSHSSGQPLERLEPEDALRDRRGDDAAEARAVGLERPAFLCGKRIGVVLRIDRADRLRRVRERRISSVDLDERQQRRKPDVLRQLVAELLLQDVADHALGLRAE